MFSQFVTAAKGLFKRQDSDEAFPTRPSTPATTRSLQNESTKKPKMVTATRRGNIDATKAAAEHSNNNSPVTKGKRKSGSMNAGKADTPINKRRKRSSLEAAEEKEAESSNEEPKVEDKPAAPAKAGHVRFGSEEPEEPVQEEEVPEPQQDQKDDDEESSDDEAPETIDNSAQLSKIKSEAKKQEAARQVEEQLKKEKRKQLDERRKLQAKSIKKKEALAAAPKPGSGAIPDDLLSESTATLQGSTTQDARRLALPALLPDDILSAAPDTRPPTPPAEEFNFGHKKPNKMRFFDKAEHAPKDVKMGDVTIRVLDGEASQKKPKTTLPPKASKAGRNSKQNWLNRSRSTAHVNGLRRTTGGSSGFVRK
ncbi:hypothetical protein ASPWEDRAFT_31256 [Aspergillus wentii DTO 134E9]|uniref:Immediate-early protein n=1 Tax=Aspergillus wentii DTO 134E9 TaxID=1073089 RepID=A0A1L9RBP0_ASPWE|nr:uncharacterized protein ASPWEDRAFT_31256 [Aspergillus wentii DTO 134E9]KAI9934905.1 hypothetical protein MW887_000526 [Aspergillus wentii]OJJ32345.1 hypothetical protein ASPWEDRAFT_31256 [Aspergillus wentii DTO 134E9]